MDLTPAQRKLAFAAVVAVLAALGAFLIVPATIGHKTPGRDRGRAVGLHQPLPKASSPDLGSTPGGTGGAGGLGASPGASPEGAGPDIYQLLPFSQAGLAAAVGVARQFAVAYASYSYTESAASYEGKLRPLVTPGLAAIIARGYATPGVAGPRAKHKEIATGSGRITAIRAFGTASITFLVTITQKVTGTQGTQRTSTGYAVTVAGAATHWLVSDLQLASAGNS